MRKIGLLKPEDLKARAAANVAAFKLGQARDKARGKPPAPVAPAPAASVQRPPAVEGPNSKNVDRLALMIAAENGCLKTIREEIAYGADVNTQNAAGKTALMKAARGGHTEIIEFLLGYGATVDAKDNKGRTALMHAAIDGRDGPARVLYDAGADVDAKDNYGKTALDYADCEDALEVATILRGVGAKHGSELP